VLVAVGCSLRSDNSLGGVCLRRLPDDHVMYTNERDEQHDCRAAKRPGQDLGWTWARVVFHSARSIGWASAEESPRMSPNLGLVSRSCRKPVLSSQAAQSGPLATPCAHMGRQTPGRRRRPWAGCHATVIQVACLQHTSGIGHGGPHGGPHGDASSHGCDSS